MINSDGFKNYLVKDVFLFTLLTFLNLITHETLNGSLISIPQFIFILFLIITNRTEQAFKYHIIFTLTCLAIPFSQILEPGAKEYGLYNYSKFKLFGPVGVFHIISLLFFILTINKKLNFSGLNLFGLLYKVLLFLTSIGIIFGFFGLLFFDYYWHHFLTYSVYMLVIILHLIILARYNSPNFLNRVFQIVIALLISAPFASLIINILGFVTYYGNNEVSILTEMSYYSIFLIFTYYQFKSYFLPIISTFITFYLFLDGGTGGKGVIFVILALIFFLKFTTSNRHYSFNKLRKNYIKFLLIPIICFVSFKINDMFLDNKLLINKIDSVYSLFYILDGAESLDLIAGSPRVRVGSLYNILYGQLSNPLHLFLGQGYGAYFYDYFHVFNGLDLSHAFRYEETVNGMYGRPHDTIAAVPLSNGFIGLFLLIYLSFKYISRLKYNFLSLAVIPWLLFTFYFNSQFALVGLVMLYASEKKITLNSR